MKKYPHVTVIILNFNGFEDTKSLCLPSLLKTSYKNFSIIVVDNGSSVNEAKLLEQRFKSKKITFMRNSRNLGFTGGNNSIIKIIKSKYTVFLNNDTMAKTQWLTELVKEMESSIKIAACQPKVLLYDQKNKFDYAGGSGGFIDKYGYPFTRGRMFSTSETDEGQYDAKSNLFWASGVAMMVRTNVFKKVGMFDNRFFLYMEEIDVCWRLLQKGYLIRSVPSAVIYHKVAASAKKNMFRKRYYEHRNNLMMVVKNYSKHDLITLFPKRLIFEFICSLYYLFFDFTSFRALIAAHIYFWKNFSFLISQRNKNTPGFADFKHLVYGGSIVIDYFILQKRKFSNVKM